MYRVNQQTGKIEDENGNPITGPVPIGQVAGAPAGGGGPVPPAALAATPIEPLKLGALAPPKPVVLAMGDQPETPPVGLGDLAAPAPPASALPALPTKKVEGGTTSVTRTKINADEKAGNEAMKAAAAKDTETAGDASLALQAKAKVEENAAHDRSTDADQNIVDRKKMRQELDSWIAKKEEKYNKAVADRSGMSIEEFGAGDPAWKTIGRAVAVGLGELGAALSRSGHNTAREVVNDQAQEHYMLQRQKLADADRKVTEADKDRGHADQVKLEKLADFDVEAAAREKALQVKVAAEMAKVGTQNAQVVGQQLINDSKKREAGIQQQIGAVGRQQIESRTTWADTTGSATGAGRAQGVQIGKAQLSDKGRDAVQTIEALARKGVTLSDADRRRIQDNEKGMATMEHTGALGAYVGRHTVFPVSRYEGLSPEKQELAQAHEVLAQIGAAVTSPSTAEPEMKHARDNFDLNAPGIGEVARAKTFMRLKGIVGAAGALGGDWTGVAARGSAAAEAGGAPPSAPSAPGGGAGRRIRLKDGRTGTLDPDGVTFHPDGP